ncbi:MAG: hypothetical protein NUW12_08780 [Firmicutes bacterium]|jgi:hypothetical protein|nr:hypothetical protein [Bacillota bacterium]MDH7496063.1 hypothetical protein [Bacillota bacterium]
MEPWTIRKRLIDACLALGHICTVEAKWSDDPEVRTAMVQHAIGFLDAARCFLKTRPSTHGQPWSENAQQESHTH